MMRRINPVSGFMRGAALALLLCCGNSMAADGLLWFDGGRPGPQARQAVELLSAAATHGLEPQDYNASALRQAVMDAMQAAPPQPQPATIARLEPALTTAMERYLADLHTGRIDPRQAHHDFKPLRREAFDPGAYLRDALAARRLSEAAREAAPRMPLYERLREQLARYRGWIGHPAWQQPLPPLPGDRRGLAGKLEPGQDYAGLAIMAQRLVVLGDLALDAITPPRYEEPLISAVQAFQQRHGLAADGVIGKATLTQLQVAPADRARQIELALERLRWTPLMQGPRMIVINIPEFVLRAYEVRGSRIVVLQEMKVIVGKTMGARTPLFDEDLRFIEFSPYWNVPPSIARAEVVPRLRRDPGYFAREGFEFVSSAGQVDTTLSTQNL
ncbi:MAG: L,D-transpeptidase family protein, partial [Polaromonas sp.]|nr:L,D-transpeptidase family protein [Polaromonas sp.]